MKRDETLVKILDALETVEQRYAPNSFNACACMGPREGCKLCPCEERAVAYNYVKQDASFVRACVGGNNA